MEDVMLTVIVFFVCGFGFYVVHKADQFWSEMQENMEDNLEEKQHSSKILSLNTLSDEDLIREIHECKSQYKEGEILIFDRQSRDAKKIFDHNTVI